MIIHRLDEATRSLVESVVPRWTEMRARKSRFFSKPDASTIKSLAIMLAGEPSMGCCVKSRDLIEPRIEYFTIGLECRDPLASDTFEWITLAKGRLIGIRTKNSMALRKPFPVLADQ
jgi:hypothetical protein